MIKHPGHHIGDVWFHVEGDVVHAFYLVCPESVPRCTRWDIGHATSRDLLRWDIHPLALRHGGEGSWHERLATGSIFRNFLKGPRYGMAFTTHTTEETGMAWSDDLFTWTADPIYPTTTADLRFYEPNGTGKRTFRHWRDPFVLQHEGRWYQFVCASDPLAPAGARGTVGVVAWDGSGWKVAPPVRMEPFCQEMECPQIVVRDGRCYLLFSTLTEFIAPQCLRGDLAGKIPWGGTFVMMSESLLGPYRIAPSRPLVTAPLAEVPYACQHVSFKGGDYLLGTHIPEGELSYISDPHAVEFTAGGVHLIQG